MIDFGNIKRLNEDEFHRFAKLIYAESGIFLKDTKITLLSNRLRKRLQALNLDTFSEYYDYIQRLPDKAKELEQLIDVVSTNETYFFRNERQFDALVQHCLPDIAKRKANKSSGYGARLLDRESPTRYHLCPRKRPPFPDGDRDNRDRHRAVGSDFARKGEYSGRRIEKVAPAILEKYFVQDRQYPELFTIKERARKLVTFHYLNLFKSPYPKDRTSYSVVT